MTCEDGTCMLVGLVTLAPPLSHSLSLLAVPLDALTILSVVTRKVWPIVTIDAIMRLRWIWGRAISPWWGQYAVVGYNESLTWSTAQHYPALKTLLVA